jgi:hypothetical protein
MIRLAVPSFGLLIGLALWIYALLDVVQTDEILVRNLPKTIWLFVVLLFPPVGPIVWLVAGRPLYAGWAPGGAAPQRPSRPIAPEDRPDWGQDPKG